MRKFAACLACSTGLLSGLSLIGGTNERFIVVLLMVIVSTGVLAENVAKPGAMANENAPLMLSFADLKWTELAERKGMLFAVLSGDPTKGEYTQVRKVPAGTDNPLHSHSSEIKNVIISGA